MLQPTQPAPLKETLIVLAWTFSGIVRTILITLIPDILGIVDSERWGSIIGSYIIQTAIAFLIAGVLFVKKYQLAAYILTSVVVAFYVALVIYVIVTANGKAIG